jgi:hypothetical protein
MNTNAFRSQQSARRSRRRFRAVVLGLEDRVMLASAPAVAAVAVTASSAATINGANLPLSVQRVPGFLAGPKYNDLATPYDNPSITGLRIDDSTVDYWKITLNQDDTVLLTLTEDGPTGSGTSPDGFDVRIWGPDNKEILPPKNQPTTGTQFAYVAGTTGTYTIGISTSNNASYPFDPTASKRPVANSPSLHVFTAVFNVYPGAKTNLVDILQHYTSAWPAWTGNQNTAYDTLTHIATAANNQTGTGIIDFSGSFEQVGTATVAKISAWLKYSWAPFKAILHAGNQAQQLTDVETIYKNHAFLAINDAYTLDEWKNVADPFVTNPDLQKAYTKVHGILLTANQDRQNIDTFLQNLNAWSGAYQQIVGDEPTQIADTMTDQLAKVPEVPKPVQQYAWLKTLIGSIVTIASQLAGAFFPGFTVGHAGYKVAGLITSILGNAIANPLDAWLDGDFGNKPTKPDETNTTSPDIKEIARQMETFSKDKFGDTFQLLSSPGFEATLFSNYGLLQAMEHVRFSTSVGGQPIPTQQLLNDYDTTVWKQLLPKMFKWKLVPYTDNGPDTTLRNFTFFIPSAESANSDTSLAGECCEYTYTVLEQAQVTKEAREELLNLQSGKSFVFPGYDLTQASDFGPGPISVPQKLKGNAASFYTIAASTFMTGTLYRYFGPISWVDSYFNGSHGFVRGATIQEWSLETYDGKERMGPAAAAALFGTGSLVLASPDPVYAPSDGRFYTYNLNVQSGGLTTRLDVFLNWGKGVDGFSPRSFQPPDFNGKKGPIDISVDPNPSGRYSSFTNMYARVEEILYGVPLDVSKRPRPPAIRRRRAAQT